MFNLPRSSIPIYLAARQAKMFQLGGEIGDGILGCDGFCSERYVSWALENIQTGAKRAHRDPEKLDLAFLVLVSIAKSTDEAKENVKPAVISMFKEGAYEPHLRTMRLPESELGPLREALKKVDLRTAYKVVPDVLLEAAAIYGTPRECASKMKEFRNAGVDLPIVEPVGPDKQTIIRLASNW
jgi:alkanesulfonate monooxygenase SsuD/methylene tetrahydromethanopterin reductase-like flavin-dependent oxidoreductase (luciferase family)